MSRLEDPKIQRVVAAARELGLAIEPVVFESETRTAADAAREVGCEVGQIVKSLVFSSNSESLLFLVAGSNRLDTDRAARLASVERVDKADAAAVKDVTGFSIGATPPFGHLRAVPVFMDEDLLSHDLVWAAAGRTDAVFAIAPVALRDATRARVGPLRVEDD